MQQRPGLGDSPNKRPSERRSLILALARGWLLMGSPSRPVDRRRRGGYHRRLKDILLGTAESRASRDPWARFSGAMDRQALEEALSALSEEQLEVVGLAYFEGRTNRAIARHLGLSVASVQRRLRTALHNMSDFLRERGAGTWAVISGQELLGRRAWRAWLDPRQADLAQVPVREAAGVAASALIALTVLSAAGQVKSAPPAKLPAQVSATTPHRVVDAAADRAPVAGQPDAAPALQAQAPALTNVQILPAAAAVTTKSATGQALTVVNQTVARATGALPPLPPPPSLP